MTDSPLMPRSDSDGAAMTAIETSSAGEAREEAAAAPPWHSLSPRWITVERIASWIFAVVLSGIGAVVVATIVLENWPLEWSGWLLVAAFAAAVAAFMVVSHVLPPVAYRHTSYRLSDVGFEIRRGIFWRSLITVPHDRVQHTDVAQGPLQRAFDLGKLIIYTAGTQNASVELSGLDFDTACRLRDALVGRPEGADGV